MRKCLASLLLLISSLSVCSICSAEEEHHFVKVADPYIEMHTGAGRGYPIFYVAARGEWVNLIYRKTDWFFVRTEDGKDSLED